MRIRMRPKLSSLYLNINNSKVIETPIYIEWVSIYIKLWLEYSLSINQIKKLYHKVVNSYWSFWALMLNSICNRNLFTTSGSLSIVFKFGINVSLSQGHHWNTIQFSHMPLIPSYERTPDEPNQGITKSREIRGMSNIISIWFDCICIH